jgi:hypothetical protein
LRVLVGAWVTPANSVAVLLGEGNAIEAVWETTPPSAEDLRFFDLAIVPALARALRAHLPADSVVEFVAAPEPPPT